MSDAALARHARMPRTILILLAVYAAASLIHFVHNAAYLADYPNLPHTWTPAGVVLAWFAISAIGALGALLLAHGRTKAGLCIIMIYSACGLDSLGHYWLAPLSQHTHAMNATILLEVGAAALLLCEALRQFARSALGRPSAE